MIRIELDKQLGMEEFLWGGSFEYDIEDQALDNENEIFVLLDKICALEKLTALNGNWNKLSFEDCNKLLMDALRFDLAYTTGERMPEEKAQYFHEQILSKINVTDCKCYTNWFQNPWESENGASWNSITKNTFDMAILPFNSKKLIFTYLISED